MLAEAEHRLWSRLLLESWATDSLKLLAVDLFVPEERTLRASLVWREPRAPTYPELPPLEQSGLPGTKARLSLVRRAPLPASPPHGRAAAKPSTLRADHACRHPKYSLVQDPRDKMETKIHATCRCVPTPRTLRR